LTRGKRRPRTATRGNEEADGEENGEFERALARKALLESVFQGCAQQSHARIDVLIRALAENGLNH
jgi:hypothetical protein